MDMTDEKDILMGDEQPGNRNPADDIVIIRTDEDAKNGQDKCPLCGATDISLNQNTGKLRCNFCRHEFEPQALTGMHEDVSDIKGKVVSSGAQNIVADTDDMLTLKCESCGAEVVIDTSESAQARCHWCRNTLSINTQIPNGSIPDVVLPFSIKKEEAKKEREAVKIVMGPNIKPFPIGEELQDSIARKVILKTGDNITTDDICPSNAALLPFRSNIPKLSEHCFETIIPDFKERAEKNNGGIIVGGENYGQGSSREHAALLPLYLGIKAVIAKSFARIHKANLINSGIIPLEFENVEDYDKIDEYDELQLSDIPNSLINGRFIIKNITKNTEFPAKFNGSARELKILKFGGYLKFATSDEFLS